MGKVIKNILVWFLCTMVVVGICMNISPNGPLAVIALAVMVAVPVVSRFTKKDAFDKNKKAFAKHIAEQVKTVPGAGGEKNIAVVFDMDGTPEVAVIRLQGKELYREERNLWNARDNALFYRKLDSAYQLNTRGGYPKNREENLAKYRKILKYCATELGSEYVGFVHYSFSPYNGYAGSVETYNISYEGGGTDRVTVSEGGSAYFGAKGIICHRDYYEAYKPYICANYDSVTYSKRRDKYFRKEAENKKPW